MRIRRIFLGLCAAVAATSTFGAEEIKPLVPSAAEHAFGLESVSKLSELRKAGKIAEGEELLKTLEGSSQMLAMARFALYRDDPVRKDEMNALLLKTAEEDETSFWGIAAMGFSRMRGIEPLTLYWPWKASQLTAGETTITYGVDRAFAKSGRYSLELKGSQVIAVVKLRDEKGLFARVKLPGEVEIPEGTKIKSVIISVTKPGDCELVITRKVLKPRAKAIFVKLPKVKGNAANYIRKVVGEKTIEEIGSKEGGEDFLKRFFEDKEWTEQFAGSGPWSCQPIQEMNENTPNAAMALKTLDTLVWNDDGSILTDLASRNLATALALNHGYDKNESWHVEIYSLYRDWLKDGSLVDAAKTYDTREWRELVGFGQNVWLTADDHIWSHEFIKDVPAEDYGKMCWQCSYRTFNCFGDSVHGADYYRPWEHRSPMQVNRFYVGGVCGSLSNFGANIAQTHGIRSFSSGQPGHCAYMFWDYARKIWNIGYSVTGHTRPHNSLGGAGFTAANEQQRYYAHPKRMAAERLRWKGKYEESMRKAPGNWCAAVAWFNELERTKAPIEDYEAYAAAVRETFADMPAEGFQLYLPYINKLETDEAKVEALVKALKAIRESEAETVETAYFDEIALTPIKAVFEKNVEAWWTLFEAALEGQAGTKNFYRQTVNWGAANLIKDDASTKRFMSILAASVEKTGEKLDYAEMILTASRNGDVEMFRQIYSLIDKCSPETNPKPNARSWPTKTGDAVLLSGDGVLITSTTSRWDRPEMYRNLLTPTGYEDLCAFHTNHETSPWAAVKLPGPAEVKSITIVNAGGYNQYRQVPLHVWASEDGKNYTEIATFAESRAEWKLELASPIKAQYIKVGRKPEQFKDAFHLYKVLIYGKKLY